MTNKRYSRFKSEITGLFCIADENHKEIFGGIDDEYNCMRIVNILNQKEERIKELENKLNQTALEFLNHEIISMGKAVEISEMNYHDFIKYRAEHGNPMEL